MAPSNNNDNDKVMNRGAWSAEEDRKLAGYVEVHGSKRWEKIAAGSGVKRCGKSCRLRWLNYLRPNIKRGNISDDEEEMIIRLHKLLGNRWSLIAGRLPGRTDNEIKNYWNTRLEKRMKEKVLETSGEKQENIPPKARDEGNEGSQFDVNEFFDFSIDESCGLEWANKFLRLDQH